MKIPDPALTKYCTLLYNVTVNNRCSIENVVVLMILLFMYWSRYLIVLTIKLITNSLVKINLATNKSENGYSFGYTEYVKVAVISQF